ncbi:MAG TPA: FkbM family methyltransferase [Vicinamibacterales bacterium]|nr:FkbM family methyltransferase [Vicinamibacterales bacterium]
MYLLTVPGIRSWAFAVTKKSVGQEVPCNWNALVSYPWVVADIVQARERMAKMVTIEQRDDALGLVLVKTPGRSFWIRDKGANLNGAQAIGTALAERDWTFSAIPGAEVRPGDVVLDVGAHVGTFTDFALMQGAAKVIALEPDPLNVECLRRNFAKDIASGRVVLVPEGAWSSEQSIEFSTGVGNSGMGSMVHREAGGQIIKVPVRPIDTILATLKIAKVDYIKMDIEGAEKEALKGAKATLQRDRPRIHMDANHEPDDATALPALVQKIRTGYTIRSGACEFNPITQALYVPHSLFFEQL